MENSPLSEDLPNGHLYNLTAGELKETLWFDQQFISVLSTIAKGAQSLALKTECEDHAIQIDTQMERLRQVAKVTGIKLQAKENKAMAGLLDEAVGAIEQFRGMEALDTVLVCAAQKICCLRVAIYSNVITYFGLMEFESVEFLLAKTVKEERMADDRLQSIAYLKLLPIDQIPPRKKGLLSAIGDFFTG